MRRLTLGALGGPSDSLELAIQRLVIPEAQDSGARDRTQGLGLQVWPAIPAQNRSAWPHKEPTLDLGLIAQHLTLKVQMYHHRVWKLGVGFSKHIFVFPGKAETCHFNHFEKVAIGNKQAVQSAVG